MTIAASDGPWILELRVNDCDVWHMLEASRKPDTNLPVRFSLATNPETTYEGRVQEIAKRSEMAEGDRPTVRVIVFLGATQVTPLRAGSEVVARIDCGSRSLGYVWLHEAWNTVRFWVLF